MPCCGPAGPPPRWAEATAESAAAESSARESVRHANVFMARNYNAERLWDREPLEHPRRAGGHAEPGITRGQSEEQARIDANGSAREAAAKPDHAAALGT